MTGHIRRRGERSWELKFDGERDPVTGGRNTQYVSFKGTKSEAKAKLIELLAAVDKGSYVEPSKLVVGKFVQARIEQWEAAGNITARTAQRYRQLLNNQIEPHLGAKLLQKLTPLGVEAWHTTLSKGGLAARTIGHAHRVLSKALTDAEKDGAVARNVCKLQRAPKVPETEMVIVQDVPAFLTKIAGARLRTLGVVALCTGMRLGEILALRDRYVDLDGKVIEVREALEETKAKGITFKTRRSQRLAAASLASPRSPLRRYGNTAASSSKSGFGLAKASWRPTTCFSRTLTVYRCGRAPYRPTGATWPKASACPKSLSTRFGTPMHRS
jgi:integrase